MRVHTEGQRQAQAAGHLNLAGSGLHDGSDLVLEPIFEADLPSELYAYRPGRNAQQAVVAAGELLFRGHPEVVDADLADYFGSIPHAELLKSVARRIVDRRVLHLIRMWLDCPVEETDNRGRKTRTTEARDERRGIPQGSPISPLLANIYMRRFVLGWKMFGLERTLGSRLVTYADDLVILCRRGKTEAALQRLREITGKLKLTVSEEKTRICKVPEGEFDFLGTRSGRCTRRGPAKPVSATGRQRKAFSARSRKSTRAACTLIRADGVQPAFKLLARVARIFEQLNSAWDVLRTMTPSDYSEFRDRLGQSSGFQSWQYRAIEFLAGNRNLAMLRPHDHRPEIVADLTAILSEPSLYQEAILLLSRRGLDVGEAAQRAVAAEPHVECEALIGAWAEVY